MTAPSPAEYERMTEELRESAYDLLREQQAVINAQRTRAADARLAVASVATAAVVAEAQELLPEIITRHRDTPTLQHARRAALAAATRRAA